MSTIEKAEHMVGDERLFVSPDGKGWKVRREGGQVVSRHDTQAAALGAARAIVAGLLAGTIMQIVLQRPGGEIRTEWTYGQDPFPPTG